MSTQNRQEYAEPFKINIGTLIFIVIFIYIVIRIVMSIPKETLSIYEVQNSYIDTNINTNALIVRSEELVNAENSGYVSYYVRDGEKIGKGKTIYTIDETGSVYEKIKDTDSENITMSADGMTEVRTRISNFENYFDYSNFSDVYNFRYDIENAVLELTNEAMIEKLTSLDDDNTSAATYKKVVTKAAGIVTYYQDGFEKFDIHNFKASDINKNNYKKVTLKTGDIINAGEPVYKLVTSENWYLIAPLSGKDVKALAGKETVRINIHNSSKNITCNYELTKKDDKDFIIISLNQQMVNYINERYIDIVIIMDQNNGLKVPNSSILEKEVYKIPIAYLSTGSDSMERKYVNVKKLDEKGEVMIKQVAPDIYKKDEQYFYMDPNDFSLEDVLTDTVNNTSLSLSEAKTAKVNGVYCANRGTADFRYIDILYQDTEYTIVKADVDYSIAWYDRIILNHTMVKENQIIK